MSAGSDNERVIFRQILRSGHGVRRQDVTGDFEFFPFVIGPSPIQKLNNLPWFPWRIYGSSPSLANNSRLRDWVTIKTEDHRDACGPTPLTFLLRLDLRQVAVDAGHTFLNTTQFGRTALQFSFGRNGQRNQRGRSQNSFSVVLAA